MCLSKLIQKLRCLCCFGGTTCTLMSTIALPQGPITLPMGIKFLICILPLMGCISLSSNKLEPFRFLTFGAPKQELALVSGLLIVRLRSLLSINLTCNWCTYLTSIIVYKSLGLNMPVLPTKCRR